MEYTQNFNTLKS
jgi:hypothetical protein